MLTLLNDLRKTALIAGIAMAVAALWGFFGQFLVMAVGRATISLSSIVLVALSVLFLDAPFPVFLLIFYRSGITPAVSKQLRNRALVLALIKGLEIVYAGLHEWRQRGNLSRIGLPAGGHLSALASDLFSLFSMLAFTAFLIALSRPVRGGRDFEESRTRLVKKAALLAAGSRAVYLVIEFIAGLWIYSMQRRGVVHNATSAQAILRTALFALPGLASPLILYVSIGTSRNAVTAQGGHAQISATA